MRPTQHQIVGRFIFEDGAAAQHRRRPTCAARQLPDVAATAGWFLAMLIATATLLGLTR